MSLSLLDELILEPRTCTSKNLTVQSLFETTSCGSALLAQDLVSSTELLIEDPKSWFPGSRSDASADGGILTMTQADA